MKPSFHFVGSAKQVKGTVKQAVGKAVGNAKLESEGRADKVEGRFRTPSAASKTRSETRSKGNRRCGHVLRFLRFFSCCLVGEDVRFCSEATRRPV